MAEKRARVERLDRKFENKRWAEAKEKVREEFELLKNNFQRLFFEKKAIAPGDEKQINLLRNLAANLSDTLHTLDPKYPWPIRLSPAYAYLHQYAQVVQMFLNLTFAQRLFCLWYIQHSRMPDGDLEEQMRFTPAARERAKKMSKAMWHGYWMSMHAVEQRVIPDIAKMVMSFSGTGFGEVTPGMKKGFF